jgi:hypothetical protein
MIQGKSGLRTVGRPLLDQGGLQGKELQSFQRLGAGLPETRGGEKTVAGRHRATLNSTFWV